MRLDPLRGTWPWSGNLNFFPFLILKLIVENLENTEKYVGEKIITTPFINHPLPTSPEITILNIRIYFQQPFFFLVYMYFKKLVSALRGLNLALILT